MKKLLLVLCIAFTFVGCIEGTHQAKDSGVVVETDTGGFSLDEVTIDGCEYLIHSGVKRFAITHKGNCKNH